MKTETAVPSTYSSADVVDEIRQIEQAIGSATAEPQSVLVLRNRLAEKQRELDAISVAESQAQAAYEHVQQLDALHELESDMARAKAESLALRVELSCLPEKIAIAEHRLNELLRLNHEMKKQLGFC